MSYTPVYVSPGLAEQLKLAGWNGGLDFVSLFDEIHNRLYRVEQEDNLDTTASCYADSGLSDDAWLSCSHYWPVEAIGGLVLMVLHYNITNNPKENPF